MPFNTYISFLRHPIIRGTLILLLFIVFSVFPVLTMIINDGALAYGDDIASHFPYHEFVKFMISNKQLPFWNPYTYSGVPFFANIQMGTAISYPFFPLAYIKYNLLFHLFHWIVALLGMYILLRRFLISRTVSIITVFFFSLNLAKQSFGMQGAFISWIPFLFLFAELIVIRSRLRDIVGYSIILSLILLIWAEAVFYTTFMALIYIIVRNFTLEKKMTQTLSYFGVANLFALAIIAFQLLPFAEYSLFSLRGLVKANFYSAAHSSVTPFVLISMVIPKFFGRAISLLSHTSTLNYYLGIVTIFFAFKSLNYCKNNNTILPFFIVALIALLYSLGAYFILYPILFLVPPFSKFIAPSKMMIFFIFSVTVLSAFGMERLLNDRNSANKKFQKFYKYIFLMFFIYIIFAPILFLYYWRLFDSVPFILSNLKFASLYPLIFLFGLYLFFKKPVRSKKYLVALIFAISILDLYLTYDKMNLLPKYANRKIYSITPPSVKFFQKDKTVFRIAKIGEMGLTNASQWTASRNINSQGHFKELEYNLDKLQSNLPLLYKIQEANGYEPVIIKHYAQLIATFYAKSTKFSLKSSMHELPLPYYEPKLFKLLNIKYVISDKKITDLNLELVFRGSNYIYQNKNVLQRAYIAASPIYIDNDRQSLVSLLSKDFNPEKNVVVTGKSIKNDKILWQPSTKSEVKILSYEPNKIVLKAILNGDGFMVLSDAYYPGWKAYANGEEIKIFRVNHAFRGILLGKGKYEVIFRFEPRLFKIGSYITVASILLLVTLLVVDLKSNKVEH